MTDTFYCCDQLDQLVEAENVPLSYSPRVREWSLRVFNFAPGETFDWTKPGLAQGISYCPFCGSPLPGSLRSKLWDELESLGYEDLMFEPEKLPEQFQSDEWWRDEPDQPGESEQRPGPQETVTAQQREAHDCQSGWLWYHVQDQTVPFFYDPSHREWGIAIVPNPIVDSTWADNPDLHVVNYCPWCGQTFPPSLRR